MHILIIEDEPTQLLMLKKLCQSFGLEVTTAQNGEEGLLHIQNRPAGREFSLVLTDLMMPFVDGREVLEKVHELHPDIPVLIITSESRGDITDELKAMGAQDYLTKPISRERLKVSIENALQLSELKKEVQRLHRREASSFGFDDLIGAYSGLSSCVNMARKYASSDMPVLIMGESGVGKEVFARAIHGESTRAGKPFIAINCGAIPANLVESTLFGHEKGAFTGAVERSIGKFREAQGGTLFLDEVGELPLETQVKLLRALQQSEVEPVGLGKSVAVDVRIISATNKPLQDAVSGNEFRSDLYFRLAVLPLELPPLSKRAEDIPALIEHFLVRASSMEGLSLKQLAPSAMRWAIEHEWTGNVRELENTISRAVLLSEGDTVTQADIEPLARGITPAACPALAARSTAVFCHEDGTPKTLEEVTLELLELRMKEYDNDVNEVARSMGMPPSTLYRKLRDWRDNNKVSC